MEARILLGVSGCAQAEKVPRLVRRLIRSGGERTWDLIVASTEAGLRFFDRAIVEQLTGRPVFASHDEGTSEFPVPHVNLAEWASVVIVYPASANTVAKCAHGICDNLVSTIVLAARCPVYFGPMMNEAMWDNPITQANLRRLQEAGYRMVPREKTRVRIRATGRRVRTLCCTDAKVVSVCRELFAGKESLSRLGPRDGEAPGLI